jgi:hypothetical protein
LDFVWFSAHASHPPRCPKGPVTSTAPLPAHLRRR